MKINNPLDAHLQANEERIPEDILGAVVDVNDTLNIAWLSAQAVFEEKATPELALAIYDRIRQEQKKPPQ
jgi:hypothetical protein